MLEHIPHWMGKMLRSVRAGHAKLVVVQNGIAPAGPTLELASPAFGNGARLPVRFTADGNGVSPPLVWSDPPAGTASLALIVEDPDAPAGQPLVHAIVWNIPALEQRLVEGAIRREGKGRADGSDVGRNSFWSEGWLPPDPPTGHGSHDYVFQLFALSQTPALDPSPGRTALVDALRGHVLAAGILVGTYSRGDEVRLLAGAMPAPAPA